MTHRLWLLVIDYTHKLIAYEYKFQQDQKSSNDYFVLSSHKTGLYLARLASSPTLNLAASSPHLFAPASQSSNNSNNNTLSQQLASIQNGCYLSKDALLQTVNHLSANSMPNVGLISKLANSNPSTMNSSANARMYPVHHQFKNEISIENYHHQTNRLNKLRSCNGGAQLNDNSNLNGTTANAQITNLASNLAAAASPTQQPISPPHQLQLVGLNGLTNLNSTLNGLLPSNQLTPAPSPQDHCILNGSNSSSTSSSSCTNAATLLNGSSTNLTAGNNLTNNNVMSAIAALAAASQSNLTANSNQQQLLHDALNSLANGHSASSNKQSDSTVTGAKSVGKSKFVISFLI